MSYYEVISTNYRYGKVKLEYWDRYILKVPKQICQLLKSDFGIDVEGVYLENFKSPEPIIVMDSTIPFDRLKEIYPSSKAIRYIQNRIYFDDPWVAIESQ